METRLPRTALSSNGQPVPTTSVNRDRAALGRSPRTSDRASAKIDDIRGAMSIAPMMTAPLLRTRPNVAIVQLRTTKLKPRWELHGRVGIASKGLLG